MLDQIFFKMMIQKHIPKIVLGAGILSVAYAFFSVGTGKNALNNNGKYLAEDGSSTNGVDPKQVADALHEAMRSINITNSDKNEVILDALSSVNNSQFYKICIAFGARPYNPRIGNDTSYFWIKPDNYRLPFWLKSELNKPEYAILQKRYSQYLK